VELQILGDREAYLATATCNEDNPIIENHFGRFLYLI
jgi:hypothetical protein